ncbi:MAG: hypothetical protein NTY45_15985 [Elusimicrobia bacterium]|nr:hypothetical protein [Elusimicrobiota bacterium]
MNIGRRRAIRLLLLFLAALAAGIVLKEAVVPGLLRRRLVAAVQDNCKTCELSLGRVSVSLWPLALSCKDVRFTGGTPNATVIHAEAGRVYAPFSLLPLFKSRFRIGRIEIEQPAVIVTEGDLSAPSSGEDSAAPGLDLEVDGIVVRNSSFTYIREHAGLKGILGASRINAVVGPIGSSDRLRDADAAAAAEGLLEHSGQFSLQVRAKIYAKAPDVDVNLQIAEQDLAALNPFFRPNCGIRLKGVLIEGRASAAIRGERLHSSAYLRYRGFSLKIKKNEERGGLSAFFQNIVAAVTMSEQNAGGGNYDRRASVDLERKHKETLISFVLRGMKEAALEVSSRGGNREGAAAAGR